MNRFTVLSLCVVFLFFSEGLSQETKKSGEEVTIVGEVIDSQCYITMGAKGQDHRQCAIDCANGGIPLAILEEKTGNIYYVGNSKESMKGANDMLVSYASQKVLLKGRVHEKGGTRMILVKSVEKAK
jgi:hypothetical protein